MLLLLLRKKSDFLKLQFCRYIARLAFFRLGMKPTKGKVDCEGGQKVKVALRGAKMLTFTTFKRSCEIPVENVL